MRIKVSATTDASSSCDFWYVIDDKAAQKDTILDLQQNLNTVLPLAKKPKQLNLTLDGFQLLPTSPLQGLIRDGDTIKAQVDPKNRKTNVAATHALKSADGHKRKQDKTKKLDKTKANKTKIDKTKKLDKIKKLDKTKSHKTKKLDKTKKPTATKEDTKSKSKKRKQEDALNQPTANTSRKKAKTTHQDDDTTISKSHKRNNRRAAARIARLEKKLAAGQQSETSTLPATHSGDDHASIETNKDYIEPPHHLLKQNKNKKKNFLKPKESNTRSHVIFDGDDDDGAVVEQTGEEQYDGYYDDRTAYALDDDRSHQSLDEISNAYGGAFITESESQPMQRNSNKKKRQNYLNRSYPVDALEPVFFATGEQDEEKVDNDDKSSSSSSSDSDSSDSSDSDSSDSSEDEEEKEDGAAAVELENPVLVEEIQVVEKVDYEACPVITFGGPLAPVVGDHLAIKTLHLSDTYTPEISDWMEIIVIELTGQEMVVDRVGQANPSQLKVKNDRLRKFDLPPEHDTHQDENDDDIKETFNYADILEIRRIVK